MKSYLVDALRQAGGTDGDATAEEQPVAVVEEPLAGSGEAGDFEATEIKQLEIQENVVDECAAAFELAVADSGLEVVEEKAGAEATIFAATAPPDARSVSPAHQSSMFARIGRLTPVLCLGAMLAAAGSYMLVNRLEFNNLNQDLEELSERVRLDSSAGVGPGGWQDLPVTDVSVINEIVARNAGGNAPELPDSTRSEEARLTDVAEQPASAQPVSRRADTNIRVRVTGNTDSEFDDHAFASVLAAFDAYRIQEYELAEQHYLRALEIEPHHSDALAGLAAVYQQTGRERRAADTYQKLLGFDPENTLAASAIISLRTKDADRDTESELKLLLQRFPKTHYLHFALGSYFAKQNRWADARHQFLAAYQLAPRNADYSFNVAVSMEKLGEYDDARIYYETAVATAENSSNVDKDVVTQHLSQMTVQSRERL